MKLSWINDCLNIQCSNILDHGVGYILDTRAISKNKCKWGIKMSKLNTRCLSLSLSLSLTHTHTHTHTHTQIWSLQKNKMQTENNDDYEKKNSVYLRIFHSHLLFFISKQGFARVISNYLKNASLQILYKKNYKNSNTSNNLVNSGIGTAHGKISETSEVWGHTPEILVWFKDWNSSNILCLFASQRKLGRLLQNKADLRDIP